MSRYTQAGFLAIDNNAAEREMKRIALARKNFLFVGSDNGGRTAAVLRNTFNFKWRKRKFPRTARWPGLP